MRRTLFSAVLVLAIAVLLGPSISFNTPLSAQQPTPPPPVGSWADTVAGIRPAVVTVVNEQQAGGFGTRSQEAGRGTGFVIDDDGHVVTNWHVVRGGDSFRVILPSGETRAATLVGSDELSDLAVIRIEGESPRAMRWADSDTIQPGQPVLAAGSALGTFTYTVTDGIISALGRDLPGAQGQMSAAYNNLIQHNAAINPGNSGGPLVNQAGEVLGVNTLGITQIPGSNATAQGLFFAIPSNTAAAIVRQLIEKGRVAYPYMGVVIQPITEDLAGQYDLPVDHGVYVEQVSPGSPAAEAGVQQGDFIVQLDGQRIDSQNSFSELLLGHEPGQEITVTVVRNGEEQQLSVTLTERSVQ